MYVRKDEMTQDDLVEGMQNTFVQKEDKDVPSVAQILNEEDKKEEETKKEPDEKKENTGPDFENMSLTEQLEMAKNQAIEKEEEVKAKAAKEIKDDLGDPFEEANKEEE